MLKSIFDSQESVLSKKTFAMLNPSENRMPTTTTAGPQISNKDKEALSSKFKRRKSSSISIKSWQIPKVDIVGGKIEEHRKSSATNNNAVDQELEQQELFILHFMSSFKLQQQRMKKRKDKAKRLCLVAEILVFVGIFILTVLFTKTIFTHLETIRNISNKNAQLNDNDLIIMNNTSNFNSTFLGNFTI